MKHIIGLALIVAIITIAAGFVVFSNRPTIRGNQPDQTNTYPTIHSVVINTTASNLPTNESLHAPTNTAIPSNLNSNTSTATTTSHQPSVVLPMDNYLGRITKKPFGIYVTPKSSPIHPEVFTGYHTGADAEVTPNEESLDLPVSAVADGTVVYVGQVSGYGGVVILQHHLGTESVLSLYGHLRLSSITVKKGNPVTVSQKLGVLGTGYTSETSIERRNLHFGIIKGQTINLKGYVSTKSQLTSWEDPVAWLRARGAA